MILILRFLGFILITSTIATPAIDLTAFPSSSVIRRDVVIVGGGSSGTYAAIRLHDTGKSVALIESQNRLGGHTNTYTDLVTKGKIDIGVILWHNASFVRDYFGRFNISLSTLSFGNQQQTYVDYQTGNVVAGYSPRDPTAGLAAYFAQQARFPYLETGFNLPEPIPVDLLLPFGDFVTKYALHDAVQVVFNFAQGVGNFLHQPTLYVLKNVESSLLQGLQTGFLTTTDHDNSELYEAARGVLGQGVLLESRVLATDRTHKKVGAGPNTTRKESYHSKETPHHDTTQARKPGRLRSQPDRKGAVWAIPE